MDTLEGLAQADAMLGTPVPLPRVALPLARWVEVTTEDDGAVEVAWNLDDSRAGTPGRLALLVGRQEPAPRELADAGATHVEPDGLTQREAPLPEAQPSLRPVHELHWRLGDLFLRLTGQGPWEPAELRRIARSVG